MFSLQRRRGNALMITLIALAVLLMLVAAAIQFTGTNQEAAIAKSRSDEVRACADVARKMLLGKLRTFGVAVADLKINNVAVPDQQTVITAHYDQTTTQPVIVNVDAASMSAAKNQVRDVSNVLAATTLGGQYYRVVVTCRNPSNNTQSEVEFTFRHGL